VSQARKKEKDEGNYLLAFNTVASSDINIRIVLGLDKSSKETSGEELFRTSLAGNEGIFEYNIGELTRSGVVSPKSPYSLTKLGKTIVENLRPVLP
jgi:predicted transcriptional regulator